MVRVRVRRAAVVVVLLQVGLAASCGSGDGGAILGGAASTSVAVTTTSAPSATTSSVPSTTSTASPATTAPPVYGTMYQSAEQLGDAAFVSVTTRDPGRCSATEEECVMRYTVPAGRDVVLTSHWITDTIPQAQDFLDAMHCEASFDGTTLADVDAHWSLAGPYDDFDGNGTADAITRWNYPVGAIPAGTATAALRCDVDRPISDGWTVLPAGTAWDTAVQIEAIPIDLPDLVTSALVSPTVSVFSDFTTLAADDWYHSDQGSCSIEGVRCVDGWAVLSGAVGQTGAVRVDGQGSYGTGLVSLRPLHAGQAVLVTFLYAPTAGGVPASQDWGQTLEFYLSSGSWGDAGYRRFGLGLYDGASISGSVFHGADWVDTPGVSGSAIVSSRPTAILLAVDEGGRFAYRVQEFGAGTDWPGTTSPIDWVGAPVSYLADEGADWSGRSWSFEFHASGGTTVLFMSFSVIDFSGFASVLQTG